jgi:hypothetical protein
MLTFCEFMAWTLGQNWVVARRTKRIVRKYGDDVVCISQRRYSEMRRQFEADPTHGNAAFDARNHRRLGTATHPARMY